MGRLPTPTFQAAIDSLFSMILLGIFTRFTTSYGSVSFDDLRANALSFIAFACFFMASVVLNNASLTSISLSINQLIKGCNPLPTLLFSFVLTRIRPRLLSVIAVLVVILGTSMAIPYGSPSATTLGMVFAVCSMLATSLRQSFSQYLMGKSDGRKLEPIVLAFWQSALSAPVLLLLWLCNVDNERVKVIAYWGAHPGMALGMSCAISVSACVYTVVMFYFTRLTSAVTLTVAGSTKMILLIVVPAVMDPYLFRTLNWIGFGIWTLGFAAYSYLGHREVVKQQGVVLEHTPLSKGKLPDELPAGSGPCGRLLCCA